MLFRNRLKEYTQAPITHYLVEEMLPEYYCVNDKISELLKSGQLLSVRRGLYVAGPETDLPIPNLFLIANHLRGPSYVSLESALAYWQMIPEKVHEISCVTLKTAKKYTTSLGRFSFQHLATPYYSFGICSVKLTDLQTAMIASREKAICDKIILTSGVLLRSTTQTLNFLLDDMRIDEDMLHSLDANMISTWIDDAPKKNSLEMLVKTLEKL